MLFSDAAFGCCSDGKIHTKAKDELVGTTEEPTTPLSDSVSSAMFAAHNNWGQGSPMWLDVFNKEFLTIPRYPCFEEIRVGTWGDGGKWLCLTSLHKPPQDLVVYRYATAPVRLVPPGAFQLSVGPSIVPLLWGDQAGHLG